MLPIRAAFAAGLHAGIGMAFRISERLSLTRGSRYVKGLMNISALPMINDGSIRTHAVSLLVGCSYRFGKAL